MDGVNNLEPDEETVHQNSLYGNPVDLMLSQCFLPRTLGHAESNEDAVSSLRNEFNDFNIDCMYSVPAYSIIRYSMAERITHSFSSSPRTRRF